MKRKNRDETGQRGKEKKRGLVSKKEGMNVLFNDALNTFYL